MGREQGAWSWGCLLGVMLLGACTESPQHDPGPPAVGEREEAAPAPSPVDTATQVPPKPTPPKPMPPESAVKWLRLTPDWTWPGFVPVAGSEEVVVQGPLVAGSTDFVLNRLDAHGDIVWTRSYPNGEGWVSHVVADGSIYLLRTSSCGDDYHGPGACEEVVDFGGGNLFASGVVKLDARGDFLWQYPIMSIASGLSVNEAGEVAVSSYASNYSEGIHLTRPSPTGQVRWNGGGYNMRQSLVMDDARVWTTLEDGCEGPYSGEVGLFLCEYSANRTLLSQRSLPGLPMGLMPQADGSLVMQLSYSQQLRWGDTVLPGSCKSSSRCEDSTGLVALSREGTPTWAVRLPTESYPHYHVEGHNIWSLTCPTHDDGTWCARVVRLGTEGSVHAQKPLASPDWSSEPDKVRFHQVTRLPGGDLLLAGAFQGQVEIAGQKLSSEKPTGFLLRVTPEDLSP